MDDVTENLLVEMMTNCANDGIPCEFCPINKKCREWWEDADTKIRQTLVIEFQAMRRSKRHG